jgi:excisionase family DNA binding protein
MFPFSERVTCTISEACAASGLGRTKIYEILADGRLESTRIDRRRLILVASLLKLLEPEQRSDAG